MGVEKLSDERHKLNKVSAGGFFMDPASHGGAASLAAGGGSENDPGGLSPAVARVLEEEFPGKTQKAGRQCSDELWFV